MRRHSPLQQFKEARQIAHDHGPFVVEKGERYLLYRKQQPTNIYLGARANPEALRAFVCKVANFR